MPEIFLTYTEEQEKIINEEGDLLIIAGPGTGKTYTLLGKIRHLLEDKGIPPEKIIILTFAVKTSHELKEKLKKTGILNIKVDTFHGFAYDLWKDFYQKEPPLISEEEKKKILKNLFPKIKQPLKDVNRKNLYFKYLKKYQLLDFDLLLYEVSKLPFHSFKDFYIIIDEFQDLSPEILSFLKVFKDSKFILFGDPNQSIYSFKGVDLYYLQKFWAQFRPQTKILTLTLSFRCTENILKYAEKFKNSPWMVPPYKSTKPNGIVQGYFFPNIYQEGKFLVKLITKLLGGLSLETQTYTSISPGEIFILSRIKNSFLHLKEIFQKEGLPIKFPEEKAQETYEKLTQFLKNVEGSLLDIKTYINQADQDIKLFLENIWYLSQENKEKFIAYLKNLTPMDFVVPDYEGINFLSIHASKGLEAEYVFLIGVEKGLVPLTIFPDTIEEEEMRLVYVALTRAKKGFYFTGVKNRQIFSFRLNFGISPYFKNFPIEEIKPAPKKPKQTKLF